MRGIVDRVEKGVGLGVRERGGGHDTLRNVISLLRSVCGMEIRSLDSRIGLSNSSSSFPMVVTFDHTPRVAR